MRIAKSNLWESSHTDLTKYFIEKIKQRVDYEETISKRHRTTNGFTLIKEIIDVATLTQKRIKSVNRLISLVNEAKSDLSSSIINDYILINYHPDIVEFYSTFNPSKLKENGKELSELLIKSKINATRLDSEYYLNIKYELNKIDFNSSKFERSVVIIDKLIDCLIPYLLYQGYSTTGISNVAYRFIRKDYGTSSPRRIIGLFDGKIKPYVFLLRFNSETDEINEIKNYLDYKKTKYYKVNKDEIKQHLHESKTIKKGDVLYLIEHSTIDPHNYLRNIYEISLKNYVSTKDRLSLDFFTNFFDNVYWRFDKTHHKFQKTNLTIDPINVPKRKSTLTSTLETIGQYYGIKFDEKSSIPLIKQIRDCLYYYNLALGSKSIENSLSLFWTSLETLLPYRIKDNDIENVQYFVSKSLSIGAIGREITSFARRYIDTNWNNDSPFNDLGIPTDYINYKPEGIKKWINWLAIDYSGEESTDPYDTIKSVSNLLCKEFCKLNNIYIGKHPKHNTSEYWLNKIKNSESSISFQLDRIYLHRNQIVHSGKFINEYSNLWNHLEWYVGKLLSFCIINYTNEGDFNKEKLFMSLEADYDQLKNVLEQNKDKAIKDIPFIYSLVTKHSWQFF